MQISGNELLTSIRVGQRQVKVSAKLTKSLRAIATIILIVNVLHALAHSVLPL
jgi:hypothetical protein